MHFSSRTHVITHPLLQYRLTCLRDENTASPEFARHLREFGVLLAYEMTRDLATVTVPVTTPLSTTTGHALARPVVLVPILRAGLGLAEGMAGMLPGVHTGHIGMFRDEVTLEPHTYYCKLPPQLPDGDVLLIDPMLATGHTAAAAVALLKEQGATSIRFGCLIASPEGISTLHAAHPDIPIFTAAIDQCLNEKGYIVPGLGDAGDRYFGTV